MIISDKHILTVCWFISVGTYLTTNAHCGYDLPFFNTSRLSSYLFGGAEQHGLY